MREMIESIKCDLCTNEMNEQKTIKYPVIFTTDQTEGKTCEPYISMQELDICVDCQKKVLKITGYGAMGNNLYKILESED